MICILRHMGWCLIKIIGAILLLNDLNEDMMLIDISFNDIMLILLMMQ